MYFHIFLYGLALCLYLSKKHCVLVLFPSLDLFLCLLLWLLISIGSIVVYQSPLVPSLLFLGATFFYGFYFKIANAYAFTDHRVLAHRGWLSTNLVSIDYSKITNVTVEEPFFTKIFTAYTRFFLSSRF